MTATRDDGGTVPRALTEEEMYGIRFAVRFMRTVGRDTDADNTVDALARLAFLEALLTDVAKEWPDLEWAGSCQGESCCLFCRNETGWHGAENKHTDDCRYATLAVRLRAAARHAGSER